MSESTTQSPTPTEIAASVARRIEYARTLKACRPSERQFLKQLPKSGYSPYTAGQTLGISTRTVWNMLKRPRVMAAMQLFLRDALADIGVSHVTLVADLVEIKQRCMQVNPVLDKDGKPTGDYTFDAKGAIAAIKELANLLKIAPAKRVEVTTSVSMSVSATKAMVERLEQTTDPNDAALEYQRLMYGTPESSDAVN